MHGLYNINRNSETQHQPLWSADPKRGKRTNEKNREIIKINKIMGRQQECSVLDAYEEWI